MSLFSLPAFLLMAQVRVNAMAPILEEPEVVSGSRPGLMIALAFATIAIAVVGLTYLKQHSRRTTNDSGHLFLELCRKNQLSRRQRQLLYELSEHQQMTDPNQVLLNAELWQLDPAQTTLLGSEKVQAELRKLRSLLFNQGRHTPAVDLGS